MPGIETNVEPRHPGYVNALKTGDLEYRVALGREALNHCTLCPRRCGVDRNAGETGICKTAHLAVVASYNAHFGEETPLVGQNGSGTIFFTHCNLLCNFCQNFEISHKGEGVALTDQQLAAVMLELQRDGCHNINFVTPSHVVPQILSSVFLAAQQGLHIPLVYNSGGYDRVETLELLDGIFDIYMPDFKFWDTQVAAATCDAPDYPEVARAALIEMHRQVGELDIDDDSGLAVKGLLVRHLLLPGGMAGTTEIMAFIADSLSRNTYVNVMPQYRPCGRAADVEGLAVALSAEAYRKAIEDANAAGITRLDRRRRIFEWW
jgi:putative pyruvate formate lyase activating enzyme